MLQKYNKWLVMRVFFEDPEPKGFQLREISRKVRIAPTSVKRYLNELVKDGFIKRSKHHLYGYPVYWANRDEEAFKFYKKIDTIIKIKESGFLDYLWNSCMPNVIVLFGSASKGEDIKSSDMDIFLQCEEKKLAFGNFEKKFKRKINLFFEGDFRKLSKELRNNILNGTILKGYLKVF